MIDRDEAVRAYDPRMPEPIATGSRATLEAERARLHAGLKEGIVAPGPMTYGSQAAAASQVFEQQRDLALREKNEVQLEAVETCVRCGRPIAPERLEALPWAAHCIDCQRIVGRGG